MTPLQLGPQEYVNTQKNLLAIVASQPFYKTLVSFIFLIVFLSLIEFCLCANWLNTFYKKG